MSRDEDKNINVGPANRKDTEYSDKVSKCTRVSWDNITSIDWTLVKSLRVQGKGPDGCYVDRERVTLVGAEEAQIRKCISMCSDNLHTLDLSYSAIRKIPKEIHKLKSLRYLDLRGLRLVDLPEWLLDIAEGFTTSLDWRAGQNNAWVRLHATTVDTIPDMSIFDQPYEIVSEWFRSRSRGSIHPLNEIKVVFLGDGEAGKSHTIARLMNDGGEPIDYTDQATPGIVIKHKEYEVDGRKFRVNYWDFGGQEIMHSMHRIFLTGRTMYVVLLNARDDTQSNRAKYWLHNIQSFAPDAPVLLVLNKIDQNENASVDERDLRSRYDKLTQVIKLSAREFTRDEFNNHFTSVLLEEIQKTGFLDAQWPATWTQVKTKLENMDTHYIWGDEYQAICCECKVDDNQKNLLHWFNDLGISFCCAGDDDYTLEDYVILRPDWITNALYIILFNRQEGAYNGLIPHRSIYNLLRNAHKDSAIRCTLPNARYTAGDVQYVLGIMRKFNLSFPHGVDHEFIPMLCQQNSMVDLKDYHWDEKVLEFNMEFDYLPNNLLHRLMVDRHDELDMDNVWRTGARFEVKELGYSAVVVIDGNILRFFIRHDDPMHRPNTYLTMLKTNVDRIVKTMGLKPPVDYLLYKLNGLSARFRYDRLIKLYQRGHKEEYCEELDEDFLIEDILNQSAPDGLEEEKKLLSAIARSCRNIQDEPIYRMIRKNDGFGYAHEQGVEGRRNRRIRDDLSSIGYRISDQSQRGISSIGKNSGELDILVYNDFNEPWSIIETLCISTSMRPWDQHLTKLLVHYNRGLSPLFLITYVDCDTEMWPNLWRRFSEHMRYYSPERCELIPGSYEELGDISGLSNYLRIAKCNYICGRTTTTVYHYFVKVGVIQ